MVFADTVDDVELVQFAVADSLLYKFPLIEEILFCLFVLADIIEKLQEGQL